MAPLARKAKLQGVTGQFVAELNDLAVMLGNSDVSFIRCIKPNDALDPKAFDDDKVLQQLRSNAVLAACSLAAAG